MSSVRIGDSYKATFKLARDMPFVITAKISGPGVDWESLILSEEDTPSGHDRLFSAEYIPTVAGWYVISYNSDPDGLESMTKFYAYSVIGAITGSSTTTEV